MTEARTGAMTPEEITRLFVERGNAADAEGMSSLYEEGAVLGYPPESLTVGRAAIREVFERMLAAAPTFRQEEPLPTLRNGDLALTSTRSLDGVGVRVQVVRRQPDGSWLRVIDRPEALK